LRRNPDNPSTTFFWNDWDNEPGMKFCSLAAQGLWVKLLSLAARSREHGVVVVGEHASKVEDLPALLAPACGETADILRALIDQLVAFKVASVDHQGRLYNRRMVSEARLSDARAAAGRVGAQVTNRKRQTSGKGGGKGVGKQAVKASGEASGKPKESAPATNAEANGTSHADRRRQKGGNRAGKSTGSSLFNLSSVSKDTADAAAPPELAKITFGDCLEFVIESGKTEKSSRALIGQWRKEFGDAAIHHAVAQARIHATGNRVAYIDACLRRMSAEVGASARCHPGERRKVYQP
jgi:hypothetical protein